MKKRKNKIKKSGKMPGWLIVVLIAFIISALNALYLLIQRISWMFDVSKIIGPGVYISAALLLIYSILMCYSIYLIIKKKKKAIKLSIIALCSGFVFILWFNLIGLIIFTAQFTKYIIINSIFPILLNSILIFTIISYLKKSKKVKNYLR